MTHRKENTFLTEGDTFDLMTGICGRFVALLSGNFTRRFFLTPISRGSARGAACRQIYKEKNELRK